MFHTLETEVAIVNTRGYERMMAPIWRASRITEGSGKQRLGEPTLTAADWAEAALQLIAEKGLGALTVSTLAVRLGVTKGSFYWHFDGRASLLTAALARWEEPDGTRSECSTRFRTTVSGSS